MSIESRIRLGIFRAPFLPVGRLRQREIEARAFMGLDDMLYDGEPKTCPLQFLRPSHPSQGASDSRIMRLGLSFLAVSNPEEPSMAFSTEKPDCFK